MLQPFGLQAVRLAPECQPDVRVGIMAGPGLRLAVLGEDIR